MPRVYLTNESKEQDRLARRMDKFDSVMTEYLRSSGFTTEELAGMLGISTSTLWRYRTHAKAFEKAPFGVITRAMNLANCNNELLRYICGM